MAHKGNTPTINTLVSAIHGGLTTGQTYDLMRQITQDLAHSIHLLSHGPIPFEALNLPTVAFTDKSNLFVEGPQKFADTRITLEIYDPDSVVKGRIQNLNVNGMMVSAGINYNGTIFDDDSGNGIAIVLNFVANQLEVQQYIAGTITSVFRVEPGGIVTVGQVTNLTNLQVHELGLRNSKSIRGFFATDNLNYSLIQLDSDGMVRVGADKAANGRGHLAIPRDTNANLPAAGGTRNGLLVLDSDNNRLCYYVGSNRFHLTGVSF